MTTLPKIRRFTIEVETAKLFDAVVKDRSAAGERLIELLFAPDSFRTRIALDAAYGVRVIDVENGEAVPLASGH